jgi:hypothetical protein
MHPLDDLLDQTHGALLTGDLALLGRLAPEVQAQTDDPAAMDAGTAQRLRCKAERNAQLLQAALRGLRSARARVQAIAAGASLITYDARGRKATLAAARPQPTRRV